MSVMSEVSGPLDHIFDVLRPYEHPFVLIGLSAHRWMGCSGMVDRAFDMLIRNDQLKAIVADLIRTRHWTLFDADMEMKTFDAVPFTLERLAPEIRGLGQFLRYSYDADVVLGCTDMEGLGYDYLRLWSEDTYRINIDRGNFVEVPDLHAANPFLVEDEHHPAPQRVNTAGYGPCTLAQVGEQYKIGFPGLPRAQGPRISEPVLIPCISMYLDALVYQRFRYKSLKPEFTVVADFQIHNLTRYLYLEIPCQKNAILFQVEAETEDFLQPYLERYKRKPRHTLIDGKCVYFKEWPPETHPKHKGHITES